MFLSNFYKNYKTTIISSCLLSYTIIKHKYSTIYSIPDKTFNKPINDNLIDTKNDNLKIPTNKTQQKIKEYRAAALFEDYADLFEFDDEMTDIEAANPSTTNTKRKIFDEELIVIGDDKTLSSRSFMQIDIEKSLDSKSNKIKDDSYIDEPYKYFKKILVYRIEDNYFATGSFCGYDLTDLKDGVFLGDKIICPTCFSSYHVEHGYDEEGPNTKYLSTFPVSLRDGKLVLKIPKERIPLFSLGPIAGTNNPLDPRHFVVIGDNETAFACINTLTKVFTGKISIVTNKNENDFVDRNKLLKSFFPIKLRQSKFLTDDYLKAFKINLYDEKVLAVDGLSRLLVLTNGNKIPFDKLLIAVGSTPTGADISHPNVYQLNSIRDHANIHNAIIKPETKSICIMGNSFRSIELASSLRRYLDAVGKKNTKIYLIPEKKKWFLENFGVNEELKKMIQDYMLRNRIFLFLGNNEIQFKNDPEENRVSEVIIVGNKFVYNLPVDVVIKDNPIMSSNADFATKIKISDQYQDDSYQVAFGNIILPDTRMSLHKASKYPHVHTAGSCSSITTEMLEGRIHTDSVKTNFHLGYIAALNMMEVFYPFDDVVIQSVKILDKNLHFIGNDKLQGKFDKTVTHYDKKNERFIIYLFQGQNMVSILLYGYSKTHIYLREAMRSKLLPKYDYCFKHSDQMHNMISQEVIKNQHLVECFKHKALSRTSISTYSYSKDDQQYIDDVMKRGVTAYETYKAQRDEIAHKDIKIKKEASAKNEEKTIDEIRNNFINNKAK